MMCYVGASVAVLNGPILAHAIRVGGGLSGGHGCGSDREGHRGEDLWLEDSLRSEESYLHSIEFESATQSIKWERPLKLNVEPIEKFEGRNSDRVVVFGSARHNGGESYRGGTRPDEDSRFLPRPRRAEE